MGQYHMDLQDRGSDMPTDTIDTNDMAALGAAAVAAAATAASAPAPAPAPADSHSVRPQPYPVEVDHSRDALLTDFGKETLKDRYLLPGEGYQDLFVRVASAYADDAGHAQRIYDYISRLWFMPATPVLSNGGTGARAADLLLPQFGAPTASTASSTRGTRTSGWRRAAAASALIGATSAASASRSASMARPAASSRSSASWIRSRWRSARASLRRGSAACYLDINRTRRSRSSSKSASLQRRLQPQGI